MKQQQLFVNSSVGWLIRYGFPSVSAGKESACSAGDTGAVGLIHGSGRSLGGGNGNPLQYSCLENPMGRGAWWTTVHVITQSDMTERLSTTAVKSPSPTQWTARELPMKLA